MTGREVVTEVGLTTGRAVTEVGLTGVFCTFIGATEGRMGGARIEPIGAGVDIGLIGAGMIGGVTV